MQGDLAFQVETDLNIATGLDIGLDLAVTRSGWSGSGPPVGWPATFAKVARSGRHRRIGVTVDRSGGLAWRDRWGL